VADPAAAAAWWQPGSLLIAATPLGNPGDASARLTAALSAADLILAEDTRRLRRLMRDLGLAPPDRVLSCFDGNERSRCEPVLAALRLGERVVLVSDAGTPLVSDPGTAVIAAVLAEGLPIHALPGPSAVLIALVLSGCPTDRFTFEGFLPRRGPERRERLDDIAARTLTTVLYESPRRVADTVTELRDTCGGTRLVSLCRELTKLHEEVWTGPLDDAVEHLARREPRGEYVLVVDAAAPAGPVDDEVLLAELDAELRAGASRRDAARSVAARHGVGVNRVKRLVDG